MTNRRGLWVWPRCIKLQFLKGGRILLRICMSHPDIHWALAARPCSSSIVVNGREATTALNQATTGSHSPSSTWARYVKVAQSKETFMGLVAVQHMVIGHNVPFSTKPNLVFSIGCEVVAVKAEPRASPCRIGPRSN
ncbi:hypothetical protein VNO77_23468 [Canavalia gladiata]|uniref:Uncharacterized protein n=1 Tax=Canavalia gladiata TaxID=3824 RepID=A0AAN9QFD5_CANGL